MEALIRWHHPVQGVVYPSRCIPIARQSSLIREIDLWLDRRLTFGRIALTISGSQVQQHSLAGLIEQILQLRRLTPRYLELEVTERFVMQRSGEGIETRDQADFLAAKGCQQGQGFFFAEPAPADVVEKRFAQSSDDIESFPHNAV